MLQLSANPVAAIAIVVIVFVALAAFLTLCLCKSSADKNNDYGTEGQLKYTTAHLDISKNEEVEIENDTASKNNTNRSSTINRQLPEIPVNGANQAQPENSNNCRVSNNSLQLYEAVADSKSHNILRLPSSDPPLQPPPPKHHSKTHSQTSVQVLGEIGEHSGETIVGQPYAIVEIQSEHPYDRIKHQTTETSGESDDNYSSHIYAQSSNVHKGGTSKQKDAKWEESPAPEFPPPVPEKLFDVNDQAKGNKDEEDSENSDASENEQVPEAGASASAAIAGFAASQEIPYISEADNVNNVNNTYNSDTPSEGPYTSISVREPIANLRAAELLRQQERLTHVYTSVQGDEADQTYAEIESNKRNSVSSSTYAQVNEKPVQKSPDDVPPAPPTVESLMSVTQAHSRQASDASSASHSVLSSPEVMVREKPFSYAATDPSEFHSSQEKSSQKTSATLPAGLDVNELYAKVNKSKPEFPKARKKASKPKVSADIAPDVSRRTVSMVYSSDLTPNSISVMRNSAAYDPGPSTSGLQYFDSNVHASTSNVQIPDYATVNKKSDSSLLKNNSDDSSEPNYESLSRVGVEAGYETLHFSSKQNENNYPEYETLRGDASHKSEPDYESVWKKPPYSEIRGLEPNENETRTTYDSEPPYEGIKSPDEDGYYEGIAHGNRIDTGYDENIFSADDPPYEGINHGDNEPPYEGINSTDSEPPYEGIKHVDDEPPYEGIKNADYEPPYEGIKQNKNDPPYEGIGKFDHEPPYEGIHHRDEEPPYEGIAHGNDDRLSDEALRQFRKSSYDEKLSSNPNVFFKNAVYFSQGISGDDKSVPAQQVFAGIRVNGESLTIQNFDPNKCSDNDENDPLYEGIRKIDESHQHSVKDLDSVGVIKRLYVSPHSDSSESEYERIQNRFFENSDGSEPGYETVKNSALEEPAYETLKPRPSDRPHSRNEPDASESTETFSSIEANHDSMHTNASNSSYDSQDVTIISVGQSDSTDVICKL